MRREDLLLVPVEPDLRLALPRLVARLAADADAPALQEVMDGAPRYFLAAEGGRAPGDAARRLVEDAEADPLRRLWLLLDGPAGAAVGLLDLHLHHPVPGTAHVGLLLLAERAQERGYGREVVEALARALGAEGFLALSLAVGDENPEALGFWEHLGFGRVARLERGVTLLERRLRR